MLTRREGMRPSSGGGKGGSEAASSQGPGAAQEGPEPRAPGAKCRCNGALQKQEAPRVVG